MAVPPFQGRKLRSSLPPHYYEGYLEKKALWEKEYKKFWAGLRGLTLYFYNTNRDIQYAELLDLADFVSLADDNPPRMVAAWSTEGAKLTLRMKSQEVKLKMESLESREMWKGFILTMVEMKIPSGLALLPGHIYMLSEALEKEREQQLKTALPESRGLPNAKITGHVFPPGGEAPEATYPDCFFRVSRTEAEVLLEKNESCGNMLLRPGSDGRSISVTTRQVVSGAVILKHYKINQVGSQYIIDVEDPYCCSSLAGVVEFFVKSSKKTLTPLRLDDSYADTLAFALTDNENGEKTWTVSKPSRLPDIPPLSSRAAATERSKPLLPPRGRPPIAPPPLPPVSPGQAPRASLPENEYMVEDEPEQTYVNPEDEAEIRQSKTPRGKAHDPHSGIKRSWIAGSKPPQVPPVPPSKPPKPDIGVMMTPSNLTRSAGMEKPPDASSPRLTMSLPRGFSVGLSKELEKKLQERRATIELSEESIPY
ncbi:LOW QUALITY PROTEIN: signal-transducing adaptor protein 2 [Eublepharis macularius]|uniref:LOW QUALITY PROTEIN: signal-transducing adaptor protein 2 n=1 Tax=Eublepharis macularius TaxID=481883 RepID=A0AA97JDT2_EUBMA|nr:LOW QUALITY PROTEIN: signal-transducing adaptor protein 2 [Eublepharis macularius]